MSSAPAWLAPGAEAVILQPYPSSTLKAQSVMVDRVLKRDVVLSNGDRFRLDRLRKQVGGTWGATYYLVPPSDPRVAETREAIRVKKRRAMAIQVYEDWRRGSTGADVVAQAFAELHAAITASEGGES
jgi:hypothetical protein